MDRRLHFFGIGDDGFEVESAPQHELESLMRHYVGGKQGIVLERRSLNLQEALALRCCLAEALRRLDAEIEEEAGASVAELLAG